MNQWIKKHEYVLHILFWVGLVLAINIIFKININRSVIVNKTIVPIAFEIRIIKVLMIGLVFKILFFYTNIFYLRRYPFSKQSLFRYLLFFCLLLCASFFIEMAVTDYYYYLTNRITDGSIRFYLLKVNVLIYLFVAAISLLYFFIKEWMHSQILQGRMREEHLLSKLDVLNYQINPHFLFNILNNFYAIAEENKNHELSSGIAKLADIMRFILYECDKASISLSRELMYLSDYIDLCKLKLDKSNSLFSMEFIISGNPEEFVIAPMILIPLVENAFKHGVHPKKSSFIAIHISLNNAHLEFNIRNSNHHISYKGVEKLSSIGLENLRKRLELVYKDRYILTIQNEPAFFEVTLKISPHVN